MSPRAGPHPDAVAALARGEVVLLYDADGREGETDLVVASQFATPERIRTLRSDGGGLLCTTVAPEHHTKLGLPFAADLLSGMSAAHPVLAHMKANDLRYDPSKSSFGITINHRKTFTGIPDADRSLTITELARFLDGVPSKTAHAAQAEFGATFRTPGHVILLNGHPDGLAKRQGHTELSLELARQAGLVPSTSICEMLDPRTGRALSKADAQVYAKAHGLVFLTGADVVAAWKATVPA
ncbi:MAG: 3,4-dihydroxy-2-butanone-4-phosphate synthase [Candidatus Thermoplasmatota archaeon]